MSYRCLTKWSFVYNISFSNIISFSSLETYSHKSIIKENNSLGLPFGWLAFVFFCCIRYIQKFVCVCVCAEKENPIYFCFSIRSAIAQRIQCVFHTFLRVSYWFQGISYLCTNRYLSHLRCSSLFFNTSLLPNYKLLHGKMLNWFAPFWKLESI